MTRIYLYAAALAAICLAGWYAHHTIWQAGYDARSAEINAQVIQEREATQQARVAADLARSPIIVHGHQSLSEIHLQTTDAVQYVTKIVHDAPSPAQCVADTRVLRSTQAAIDAANATADQL